jgi:hypothetical protein
MAGELTQNFKLEINNSTTGEKFKRSTGNVSITQTSQGGCYVVQHIGGSWEAIDLGDVSVVGLYFMRNTEASGGAYVRIGADYGGTEYAFLRLLGQESSSGRLDKTDTSAPKAIAEDSAGIYLESWILQE